MQNVHVRGVDAEDAIAAIEQRLELEGFELLDAEDAPTEPEPGLRRIAVYEEDEWVGVADDPFAQTNWAEVLSYALEVPVYTLAGEGDQASPTQVVVHENGAQKVVGEAIDIPKPLFSIHDDEDEAYAILTFRFAGDAESQPDMNPFESELGDLAKLLGGSGIDMGGLMQQMTGAIMKDMMGDVEGFEVKPTSSEETGNLGQSLNVYRTFTLGGARAKGLTITLSGSGLRLFDPPEMTAEKFDITHTAKAEVVDEKRIYRFPDLELQNPSEVTVRFVGLPAQMGKGQYRFEGVLENGLSAESDVSLTVDEAFDVPLLPGKGKIEPHYAKSYAGRDFAVGWIAFDAWTELLVPLGTELAQLLGEAFTVEVVRKGRERLRFESLVWAKLAPELERGADVSLSAGDLTRGTRIELVHQPNGPNILTDEIELDENERRPPKVVFAWSIPRHAKRMTGVSKWLAGALSRAAGDANIVGGLVTAQGEPIYGGAAEFPYEHLANTRLASYDVHWLKSHVRSPGWRVLAPKSAPLTPSEGVTLTELAHANLLSSSAADPFVYDKPEATAMERAVLAAVGEPDPDVQ